MDDENQWGLRLRSALNENKVSQKEAARIAGVSASVLSGWLANTSPQNMLALKRLTDRLGVSFSFITTGQTEKKEQLDFLQAYDLETVFNEIAIVRIEKLIKRKRSEK